MCPFDDPEHWKFTSCLAEQNLSLSSFSPIPCFIKIGILVVPERILVNLIDSKHHSLYIFVINIYPCPDLFDKILADNPQSTLTMETDFWVDFSSLKKPPVL